MKALDARNILILVCLGCLVWQLAESRAQGTPQGGGGDASRGIIAVTGTYGSGASVLYLLDTRTRHLSVYRVDNGRRLEFVAARNCHYDFLLETYNDQSPQVMLPGSLRRSWDDFNRKGGRLEVDDKKSLKEMIPGLGAEEAAAKGAGGKGEEKR